MRRNLRREERREGGYNVSVVFTGLFGLTFATIFLVGLNTHPRAPAVIDRPYIPPAEPKPKTWPIAARSPADLKREVLDQIAIEAFDWKREAFGMVAMTTFTIKNRSGLHAQNIEVACDYLSENGASVGTKRKQTYERVLSGGSVAVAPVNIGLIPAQARALRCSVSDAILTRAGERALPEGDASRRPAVEGSADVSR